MIYSVQDETNSDYKHLVNSRFELFRKQDTKILSCFLNNSNLEFTRCLYSEFVSSYILSNCLREKDIVNPGYIRAIVSSVMYVKVLIGREVSIDIFMFCMTNFI